MKNAESYKWKICKCCMKIFKFKIEKDTKCSKKVEKKEKYGMIKTRTENYY